MNIAFWSEEDGCGTTSSMAAVASVCASMWNMKTTLMQSSAMVPAMGRPGYGLDDAGINPQICAGEWKETVHQSVGRAEKLSDAVFIDCGSGESELSDHLLAQADTVVVNLSQERHSLDAYFQKRHGLGGSVIYLVNQYHQESIYNKKNLNRLYRLDEGQLGVIPHNPFFRNASDRGKVEGFVRRHIRGGFLDHQFYFMQELIQSAYLILRAAGFPELSEADSPSGSVEKFV